MKNNISRCKMTTMQVCRTCLSRDIRMCTIVNTPMQIFYEQITKIPLNSQNGQPSGVCYTCYRFLQKCHEFTENAIKANAVLQQLCNKGLQITEQEIAMIDKTRVTLSKSPDGVRTTSGVYENVEIPNVKCEKLKVKVEIEDENMSMSATEVSEDAYSPSHFGIKKEKIEIEDTQLNLQHSFEFGPEVENVQEKCRETSAGAPVTMTLNSEQASKPPDLPEEQVLSDEETRNQFIYVAIENENFKLDKHCRTKGSKRLKHDNDDDEKQCIYCKKIFKYKSLLTRHLQMHTGEKPYHCSYCDKQFRLVNGLKQHVQRVHIGDKPYSCSYCGKNFVHRNILVKHERVHTGEKPFECSYCGETFPAKLRMKTHIAKVHTGEKPYACQYCEKRFIEKYLLTRHLRRHAVG